MTAAATARGPLAGVRPGVAYGLLGGPLAFVALPLYVHLPAHYAGRFGMELATLGALLLGVRALDAVLDPWIGAWADRALRAGRTVRLGAAAAGAAVLALGFQALFFPPASMAAGPALLAWAATTLTLACLAYSGLGVLHQAWGAALGGDAPARARVVAWREGAALAGVVAASVLPGLAGMDTTRTVLVAALAVAVAALALAPSPTPTGAGSPGLSARTLVGPWHDPRFRALMAVYLLNGVAGAIPATLVLFYIRDRLQWPAGEPWLLGLYFIAAAVSLPLWVGAVRRVGLAACWVAGMGLSIVAFVGAAALGPGDGAAFAVVCAASGLALGADLCAPPALLAGVLRGPGAAAGQPGIAFGWWQAATKLNLALAAGLALPLLQALGYTPGTTDPADTTALALVYALLPCGLKALALLALWRARLHRWETPA
jgi:glycoside/pentoside/hexuronide:cation symporter, GPH family